MVWELAISARNARALCLIPADSHTPAFLDFGRYENLRFLHLTSEDFLKGWLERKSGTHILASVYSNSFLESTFGQLKQLDNGVLLAQNLAGTICCLAVKFFYAQPAVKKRNSTWQLNPCVSLPYP